MEVSIANVVVNTGNLVANMANVEFKTTVKSIVWRLDRMKVVAINGSPNEKGNTYYALNAALEELELEGFETEILQIGKEKIVGCTGCGACKNTNYCVFGDETFKKACKTISEADGILIGSPVYYAGIAGTLKSFLDRFFNANKGDMRHKVGAAIAVSRRGGDMTTFDTINKYFLISEMIVAPSYYWNVIHGAAKGEVLQDAEGISTIKNLARNMAWILKMKEATKDSITPPSQYPRERTNFIR